MFSDQIRKGNIDWLRENTTGNYEPFALHILAESTVATESRRIEIAQLLLSKNCTSRNEQNKDGNTALHIAAEIGTPCKKFVEYLLNIKSDKNIRNKGNETCCDIAATPKIKNLIRNFTPSTTEQEKGQHTNTAATDGRKEKKTSCAKMEHMNTSEISDKILLLCRRNNLLRESETVILQHIRKKVGKRLCKIHREIVSMTTAAQDATDHIRDKINNGAISEHHADVLGAISLSTNEQGLVLAKSKLNRYALTLQGDSAVDSLSLDPAFFYAKYCLFQREISKKSKVFISKRDRAAVVDCLEILKLFPEDAGIWMQSIDHIDTVIQELGGVKLYQSEEEDASDSGDESIHDVVDPSVSRWASIKEAYQKEFRSSRKALTKEEKDTKRVAAVVEIQSQGQLTSVLKEPNALIVIDFYLPRCRPCQNIASFVKQLSDKYQEVIFYKIDAEMNHDIIQSAAIQSFPTFHFYLKSNKIDELVGASETKLEAKVLQHKAQSFRKVKRSSTTPSESMDTLMALVGLSSIKEKCLSIYDTVCLIKKDENLPSDKKPDRNTVMNFLFVGNPGTGKSTVAGLVSGILTDLGFRNGKLYYTTANDILNLKKPSQDFAQNVADVEGGVVVIDEVYNFKPSKGGSGMSNDSNKVLNHLLEVAEMMRATTTFILAGYKDDVNDLLTYNIGFPSRFPSDLTFDFEDFNEEQLGNIFRKEVRDRHFILEGQKGSGINIVLAASRQLSQGIGQKGFSNARTVRTYVDVAIGRQGKRMTAEGIRNSNNILNHQDVLGDRPMFDDCSAYQEIESMIGLSSVKEEIRSLLNYQLYNFDKVMKGDKRELTKLHRVFVGNPGTGKTKVARLYGKLLKELGLLSEGSMIEKKAAELIGNSVGSTRTNVMELLRLAKGKVLFIDEAYAWDPGPGSTNDGSASYKAEAIEALMTMDEQLNSDTAIILAGYKEKMDGFFKNGNIGLKRRFDYEQAIIFEDYDDRELHRILSKMLNDEHLAMEESDKAAVIAMISKQRKQLLFGNAGEVENAIVSAKRKKASRVLNDKSADTNLFIRSDFILEELSASIDVLDDLEDVPEMKAFIKRIENNLEANRLGIRGCLPISKMMENMNLLFLGPPGTGKTTVAKRMGYIFEKAGVLPSNKVVSVTSADLMGQYIGQSAPMVLEKMKDALGGILLIDEAYDLQPKYGNFGKDVIETLVQKIMEEEFKGKLVVILAGYPDKMEEFIRNCGNDGFYRRFCKERINFPPWSEEKATNALIKVIETRGILINSEAKKVLLEGFQRLTRCPQWSSAGDVYDVIGPKLAFYAGSEICLSNPHLKQMEYSAVMIKRVMDELCAERTRLAQTTSDELLSLDTSFKHSHMQPTCVNGATKFDMNILQQHERVSTLDFDVDADADEMHQLSDQEWELLSQEDQRKEAERIALEERENMEALEKEIEQALQAVEAARKAEEEAKLAAEKAEADEAQRLVEEVKRQQEAMRLAEAKQRRELLKQRQAEVRKLAKIRQIGRCPAGFAWHKMPGGYTCGGGTHFVSDAEVNHL